MGEQATSNSAAPESSSEATPQDDYYDPNRSGFVPNQNLMYGDPNMRNTNFGPSVNMGFNMNRGWGCARPWGGRNTMMPSAYFMGYSPFGYPMWSSGTGMNMGFGVGFGNGMGNGMCDPFYDPFFDPWNNPFNTPYNSAFYDPYWGMPGMCWGNGSWGNPWNSGWGNAWNNPWNNPWNTGWGWGWNGDSANNNTVYGNRTPLSTSTTGGSSYGTSGTVSNPRLDYLLGEDPDDCPGGRPIGTNFDSGATRSGRQIGVNPNNSDGDYFPTNRPLGDPRGNRPNTGGTAPASSPSRTTPPSRSNNGFWNNLQRMTGGWTTPSGGDSSPSRSGGSTSPSRSSGGSSPSVSPSRSSGSSSPSRSTSPPNRSSGRSPR